MAASITATKIVIEDAGGGVVIRAEMTVDIGAGQTVLYKLDENSIALQPAGRAALQADVDAVRTKCSAVTKTNFTLP